MNKILSVLLFLTVSDAAYAESDICLNKLKANTCLVSQEHDPGEETSIINTIYTFQNQKCMPNTSEYTRQLVSLYKLLPEHAQKAFCYINKIYIVPGDVSYGGTAQLSYDLSKTEFTKNEDGQELIGLHPNGFILKISKKYRFDILETSAEYSSRVLQQDFGVNVREDGLDPALPYVQIDSSDFSFTPSSLYGTLLHEIGHFLDFSKQHSHTWDDISGSMSIENSDWSILSWYVDASLPWPHPNVSLDLLERPYKRESAENYVSLLEQSAFSSLYATVTPPEDFAEHYLHTVLGMEFSIWQNGIKLLSSSNRLSKSYNDKTDYILKNLSPGFISFQNLPIEWRFSERGTKVAELCKHPR